MFREKFFISIVLFFCFLVWLTNAPDFRFAIGIILSISFLLPISRTALFRKKVFKVVKVLFVILISLSAFALPRFDNYFSFISEPLKNPVLVVPEVQHQTRLNGYGVEPVETNEICWIAVDCTPKYSMPTTKIIKNGYTFFYLINK